MYIINIFIKSFKLFILRSADIEPELLFKSMNSESLLLLTGKKKKKKVVTALVPIHETTDFEHIYSNAV